jgi:hypothetical protein
LGWRLPGELNHLQRRALFQHAMQMIT